MLSRSPSSAWTCMTSPWSRSRSLSGPPCRTNSAWVRLSGTTYRAAFGKGDATHTSAFHVHRHCQLGRWETPGWHTGLQAQSRCGEIGVVLGTLCLHIAASSAPQFGTRRSPMILPDPPLSLILGLGIAPSAVRYRVVLPSVVPSATIPAGGTPVLRFAKRLGRLSGGPGEVGSIWRRDHLAHPSPPQHFLTFLPVPTGQGSLR